MRIAAITGARSEYGIFRPILSELNQSEAFELKLVVSAMHLSRKYGYTVDEIEADGFHIDAKVPMLEEDSGPLAIARSVGVGTIGFSKVLDDLQPDIVLLIGDRFEALAAAQAAMLLGIPVAHVHGGELTTHAIDDSIRHAISKMSHIHFTSTEVYRKRLVQMGEQPNRVFVSGAPALDVILAEKPLSKKDLERQLEFRFRDLNFLVTYHSVTAGSDEDDSVGPMLEALKEFDDVGLIVTYPNADQGSDEIIDALHDFKKNVGERVCLIQSLGQRKYFSALHYVNAVIGNSSSGLIEVPSFQIPTINIGKRQGGRIQSESVLNCENVKAGIVKAISNAVEPSFLEVCRTTKNPYGSGNASKIIAETLGRDDMNRLGVKVFYDLESTEI